MWRTYYVGKDKVQHGDRSVSAHLTATLNGLAGTCEAISMEGARFRVDRGGFCLRQRVQAVVDDYVDDHDDGIVVNVDTLRHYGKMVLTGTVKDVDAENRTVSVHWDEDPRTKTKVEMLIHHVVDRRFGHSRH